MPRKKKDDCHCVTLGATTQLRWMERRPDGRMTRYHNILQQAWQCTNCGKLEWKDVPLVREEPKDA